MKIKTAIIVEGDEGVNHIPGNYGLTTQNTLCGWCDVIHKEVDVRTHKINCPICLDLLRWMKSLVLDKRNIEEAQ